MKARDWTWQMDIYTFILIHVAKNIDTYIPVSGIKEHVPHTILDFSRIIGNSIHLPGCIRKKLHDGISSTFHIPLSNSVQFNDMHEKRITHSDSSSEASEGSDTENDASTVQENTDVDSPNATSQVAESSIEQAVSTSGEFFQIKADK